MLEEVGRLCVLLTAKYTENSVIIPFVLDGGAQDIDAPSAVLLILMADGAPGKPGRQVLNAETSENGPRPHSLMAATRNL